MLFIYRFALPKGKFCIFYYTSRTFIITTTYQQSFALFLNIYLLVDEPSSKHVDPTLDDTKQHKYNPLLPDRRRKKVRMMTAKEKKKLRALLKHHQEEDSDLDDILTYMIHPPSMITDHITSYIYRLPP